LQVVERKIIAQFTGGNNSGEIGTWLDDCWQGMSLANHEDTRIPGYTGICRLIMGNEFSEIAVAL
jgi:hypothetical protein